ncbi:hypothetical protein [Brucepastera parasyntrophica]|nr:hypothetical protein [Brucepastera parasyntrophica]
MEKYSFRRQRRQLGYQGELFTRRENPDILRPKMSILHKFADFS